MNNAQTTALALVQALVQHRINEYNQWARQQDVPYAVQHALIRENEEIARRTIARLAKGNTLTTSGLPVLFTKEVAAKIGLDLPSPGTLPEINGSYLEYFKNCLNDKNFVDSVKGSLKCGATKVGVLALFSTVVEGIQWFYCRGIDILKDESLPFYKRLLKTLAGFCISSGFSMVKNSLVFGIVEIGIQIIQLFEPLLGDKISNLAPIPIAQFTSLALLLFSDLWKLYKGTIDASTFFSNTWKNTVFSLFNALLTSCLSILCPVYGFFIALALSILIGMLCAKIATDSSRVNYDTDETIWDYIRAYITIYFGPSENDISNPPEEFLCPISFTFMTKPVLLFGRYYQDEAIKTWVKNNGTCPFTGREATVDDIVPCSHMQRLCNQYRFGK